MPEVLGKGGAYFDPERPDDIAKALYTLLNDPGLREALAWAAYERAKSYTWSHCAQETFNFLAQVARNQGIS